MDHDTPEPIHHSQQGGTTRWTQQRNGLPGWLIKLPNTKLFIYNKLGAISACLWTHLDCCIEMGLSDQRMELSNNVNFTGGMILVLPHKTIRNQLILKQRWHYYKGHGYFCSVCPILSAWLCIYMCFSIDAAIFSNVTKVLLLYNCDVFLHQCLVDIHEQ